MGRLKAKSNGRPLRHGVALFCHMLKVYLGPSLRDPRPSDEQGVDFFILVDPPLREFDKWQGPAGISSSTNPVFIVAGC